MSSVIASKLISILFSLPCVLIAITFHEYAHGYVAYRLGDPTARNAGRLTLNPLKHLDPIGALCMLLFHFGWAKPVPINSRYFKKPRRDMALVAIAGPLVNILLSLLGVLLFCILNAVFAPHGAALSTDSFAGNARWVLMSFISYFFRLNASFAVFNLLPIPPLDGSRLISIFLPPRISWNIMKYERYIALGMLVLLYIGVFDRPLTFLVSSLLNGMFRLVGLLPFL